MLAALSRLGRGSAFRRLHYSSSCYEFERSGTTGTCPVCGNRRFSAIRWLSLTTTAMADWVLAREGPKPLSVGGSLSVIHGSRSAALIKRPDARNRS
jgi:hypothetical protein